MDVISIKHQTLVLMYPTSIVSPYVTIRQTMHNKTPQNSGPLLGGVYAHLYILVLHYKVIVDLRVSVLEGTQNVVARVALCRNLACFTDQLGDRFDVDLVGGTGG